jgi:hypothetical protein
MEAPMAKDRKVAVILAVSLAALALTHLWPPSWPLQGIVALDEPSLTLVVGKVQLKITV